MRCEPCFLPPPDGRWFGGRPELSMTDQNSPCASYIHGTAISERSRLDDLKVRLISARWATKREAKLYQSHVQGGAP
jgi:hypothetical protein